MHNFSFVKTTPRLISKYAKLDRAKYHQIEKLAGKLKDIKVFHVNSTAAEGAGGVAEILRAQVPLEQDLGLDSNWLIMKAPAKFFEITKEIHNLLQSGKSVLSLAEKKFYLGHLELLGQELRQFCLSIKTPAIFVLHDPQPLAMINYLPANIRVISRIHVDLTKPDQSTLTFLKRYLKKASRVIVSHKSFRPRWLSRKKVVISYPAIDPFSLKNRAMSTQRAKELLTDLKLDVSRPILAQVSRFDQWKDPIGVLKAYKLVKKEFPELQLVLKGSIVAKDDPEAFEVYKRLLKLRAGDSDIHLMPKVAHKIAAHDGTLVNAIQKGSDVIIQKSIKEGFGLTVTEAMWKARPVIGGNVGGIRLQIQDGKNGFLVDSYQEAAGRTVQLLKNRKLARKLGERARKTVKENFLMHRLVLDHLKIYKDLI